MNRDSSSEKMNPTLESSERKLVDYSVRGKQTLGAAVWRGEQDSSGSRAHTLPLDGFSPQIPRRRSSSLSLHSVPLTIEVPSKTYPKKKNEDDNNTDVKPAAAPDVSKAENSIEDVQVMKQTKILGQTAHSGDSTEKRTEKVEKTGSEELVEFYLKIPADRRRRTKSDLRERFITSSRRRASDPIPRNSSLGRLFASTGGDHAAIHSSASTNATIQQSRKTLDETKSVHSESLS